ncbi:MAG: glycosyltransferase family 4 protein [Lactococcus chungangensis]
MKKILILNGQYWPGYKGGGPIQSCFNMVQNLSNEFEFLIVTADRDYKSELPYENIKVNKWNQVGAAKVYYMSPDTQNLRGFKKILNDTNFDVMYLNGFFSPIFTIKPLILKKFGQIHNCKYIITPRGDFTGGLENKKLKKYSYIFFCKLIGLYKGLIWHATSELEAQDIKQKFKDSHTFIAPNLPAKYISKPPVLEKKPGELRLVFVSRIFPKKNLIFALNVLKEITEGKIIFDIYGPMEDKSYWNECKSVIKQIPSNIMVTYKGEIPHDEIGKTFERYHAFFFPTLGENYGHVIVEAMMNNCLVILSEGVTPWDDYKEKGGFLADLKEPDAFIKIINDCVNTNSVDYFDLLRKNNNYIQNKINPDLHIDLYVKKLIELTFMN